MSETNEHSDDKTPARIRWANLQVDRLDPVDDSILLVSGPQEKREAASDALREALGERPIAVVTAPDARSLIFRTLKVEERGFIVIEAQAISPQMREVLHEAKEVIGEALDYIDAPMEVIPLAKTSNETNLRAFMEERLTEHGWTPPPEHGGTGEREQAGATNHESAHHDPDTEDEP